MLGFHRAQLPALLVLCLVSAGIGAVLALSLSVKPAQGPGPAVDGQKPRDGAVASKTEAQTEEAMPPEAEALPGEADVPAELIVPNGDPGSLRFGVRRSRIQRFPSNSYYTLYGMLTNGYVTELSKIRLRMEGLDSRNKVVVTRNIDALEQHNAPLRPGDSHVFTAMEPVPASMTSCRLKVELIDQEMAAMEYPPSRLLDLQWPMERPANPPVEVRERIASADEAKIFDGVFVDVTLEVRNAGTGAIRKLELEQRYFSTDGTLLEKSSFLVAFSGNPPLLPGEIRLHRRSVRLPTTYARYAIGVLSVE